MVKKVWTWIVVIGAVAIMGMQLLYGGSAAPLEISEVEDAIFEQVNAERSRLSIPVLERDSEIDEIARRHSERMADTGIYAHRIDLLDASGRAEKAGYPCGLAENLDTIARSTLSGAGDVAEEHVRRWLDSPAHRRNILHHAYVSTGVGVAEDGRGKVYVTQNFSRLCLR